MIPEFSDLNDDEITTMLRAPLLTAILVAGADNTIDKSEMKEAINILVLKPQKARKELLAYYSIASEDIEDKLKIMLHELPKDNLERAKVVTEELKQLNTILPKVDKVFSTKFYESLKDLAKRIAESSGGVFGLMAIGYEESTVIELKMVKDPSKG